MELRKAVRKSVPMLMSISSVSGGGKTYSALLMAAGMAGPKGRVAIIDTEAGRGEMYTDSPGIMAALPGGFEYLSLDPPFSPSRYIEAIEAVEKAGVDVCVIDSGTHEWEGIGGCAEIAEKNKLRGMPNWAKAKMEHKKFMNHCLSTKMHIIFCLRARDKVKIVKNAQQREEFIQLGIQPIAEKNFVFEMLLSLQLDEVTHHATVVKCPEPLLGLFPGGRVVTKADGERIAHWNNTGLSVDMTPEQVQKRAISAVEDGTAAYERFFRNLVPAHKKLLVDTTHAKNKQLAAEADARIGREEAEAQEEEKAEQSATTPAQEPKAEPAPEVKVESKPEPPAQTRRTPPSPVALPWKNKADMDNVFTAHRLRVGPKAYSDALDAKGWRTGDLKPEGGVSVEFYQLLKGLPDEAAPEQGTLADDAF